MECRHFPMLRKRYKSSLKLRKDFFASVSQARLRYINYLELKLHGRFYYIHKGHKRKKESVRNAKRCPRNRSVMTPPFLLLMSCREYWLQVEGAARKNRYRVFQVAELGRRPRQSEQDGLRTRGKVG
jgi:hypothetical protein